MANINEVLQYARQRKCSDVHIGVKTGIVLRKDGQLKSYDQSYDDQTIEKMILSLCHDRILKLVQNHEDADFVYTDGSDRYRVNIYFQRGNVTAAIRVIDDHIRSLEELHLPDVLHKLSLLPRGLILVTGPTGSGKSTTLAAMIDFVSSIKNCHILTIEDPIEYVYQQKQALIHQREVYEDVDSFDTALKSAMREDPDIILVGEMRGYETIQAVITLAETGHLVFSTLHTVGAPKTIDRIIDVFPTHKQEQVRTQLASVLQAVITQQLLPLQSGEGRVAALEVMVATDAIKNLIRENKGHQIDSMIQTGKNEGMISLNGSLAQLIKSGQVNQIIAEEYSLDVGELRQYLQ
ncbi:type IV pilus twitching motility protein PilT [Erysipelatoclostridium sp. AM42-17]|uniref:type IV pilus twitching motility protein PilT n=1 Tax=Erysipelatoclostridium sp. AM42-17 TaxID=2293102 RepID=UPI000E490F05|nr:PilT/PilU family type 4a pilus ATPase [Erysipelatoclostridium sp. AM42-17]RHS91568.1 PilT/PilU family type 4a pilus ATPase [Erysipelatoclostridium sp. AM42-17]